VDSDTDPGADAVTALKEQGIGMTLTECDYISFLKLTIPRSIVDRAGIFRVDRAQAAEECSIELDCDGGICFPYFLPPLNGNDTRHAVAYSIRQDAPKYEASGKAERKYLTTRGRQRPYIAPIANPEWFNDSTVPIIIVEAQKSALTLLRWSEQHDRRFIPVGIAGCYGWRGVTGIGPNEDGERTEQKGLLPGLAAICRGHRVYICLDANAATNPDVQHGRDWLAQTLLEDKITNDVRILSLPPAISAPFWNGPDDFIGAAGDEAFAEVFETAQRFQPSTWESAFHKISELALGEAQWIIEGYVEEGLSFLGAKSGVVKTWLAIAEGKSLRTGNPLLGAFPVSQQRNVLYLIPEMTERRFRNRCEKLGVDINDPGFRVRTMNDGAPLPLRDPLLRQCIERLCPVIYLDTAVRFSTGKDENGATEVNQGLISATYQLIKLGAPGIRALHHRAKEASDDELTLENVLRGSGDFGASAVCVWGAVHETANRAGRLEKVDSRGRKKNDNALSRLEHEYLQESRKLGRCYLECVKPGDRELLLWDFRIQLRPSIDEKGEIAMLTAPPLARSQSDLIDERLTNNPTATVDQLATLLGASRSTAWRRATERWLQDPDSGLWGRK
jgi:hypothetical protein